MSGSNDIHLEHGFNTQPTWVDDIDKVVQEAQLEWWRQQKIDKAVRAVRKWKPLTFHFIKLNFDEARGWGVFAEAVREEFAQQG